jgi:hypothetical protein
MVFQVFSKMIVMMNNKRFNKCLSLVHRFLIASNRWALSIGESFDCRSLLHV